MNVYVLRHGTTVWNEIDRIQGRSQNRLSKNGKILAEQTAEKLKNVPFDIIFSSPLMRTMQTANIVNKFHNVKIIKNDLLIEVNKGIFTRRYKKSLTKEEQILKDSRAKNTGIETCEEIYDRCKQFVENVLKPLNLKNVLVVSHHDICSTLECILTCSNTNCSKCKKTSTFANAEFKNFTI